MWIVHQHAYEQSMNHISLWKAAPWQSHLLSTMHIGHCQASSTRVVGRWWSLSQWGQNIRWLALSKKVLAVYTGIRLMQWRPKYFQPTWHCIYTIPQWSLAWESQQPEHLSGPGRTRYPMPTAGGKWSNMKGAAPNTVTCVSSRSISPTSFDRGRIVRNFMEPIMPDHLSHSRESGLIN